ncbi:MAG: tRNA lysidine(34) synthetase TilS [Lachnospiraceae bacterium]|nr:tRNA lysidine(34) synthetase TilS [Lachnospiraceae bacterium]
MIRKVLSFVNQHHMIERGSHILAGVSGGADSVCLLLILKELLPYYDASLTAVHVEHGIRGEESRRDAAFVQQLCEKHNIPCSVYSCNAPAYAKSHGMTLEEGARELRYGLFAQAAEEAGADRIAVAHNQNDCAETLLFQLARGTGLRGMCGIVPVRGKIIRPLLGASREEIESYLAEIGQSYRIDATNLKTEYSRNKIRHQVLPLLMEINSGAVAHLYHTTELLSEAFLFVDQQAREAQKRCVSQEVLADSIKEYPSLIQKTAVMNLLGDQAGSRKDITGNHVSQVLALFEKQTGRRIELPYGLEACRTYEGIKIHRKSEKRQQEAACVKLKPGTAFYLEGYGVAVSSRLLEGPLEFHEIPKKKYTKWFDYDKIENTLLLRNRYPGDYFVMDESGRRQKLKKYLINEKVPKDQRDFVLLLADGSHVLWAIGYRISEAYKVTEETQRILEVQVNGGSIYE